MPLRKKCIGDPTQPILVDEADRLKMASLEQMRAIFDAGGVGLVLIGMPGLEKRLARYVLIEYAREQVTHPLPLFSLACGNDSRIFHNNPLYAVKLIPVAI